MVEKTKRALSILQTRDRGATTESDVKRAANEIIRVTEDRIAEIKRRAGTKKKQPKVVIEIMKFYCEPESFVLCAEEAVNEVKRQAIVELERIVVKGSKSKEDAEEVSPDAPGGSQNVRLHIFCISFIILFFSSLYFS